MNLHTKMHGWPGAALRIGGSIVALILIFHFLPLAAVWTAFRKLPAAVWLLTLAGYIAAHFVGIGKWRLMVNLGGAGLSFQQSVRCYFSGLFSTLFLPSIVGGDVVRAGLALREGKSNAGVLLGSFLDRIIDFIALGLLAAAGAALAPISLPLQMRRVFAISGIAIAVLFVVLSPIVYWFPARKVPFRIRRRLARLRMAMRSMRKQPRYMIAALSLGVFVQGTFIWLMTCVATASGLDLPFKAWLFAWPLAKLSAVIPITQGGIGVREAVLAALLIPFGARAAITVAVGLAWETVIISGGIIAGLTAFLLARFSIPSAVPAPRPAKAPRETSPFSRR